MVHGLLTWNFDRRVPSRCSRRSWLRCVSLPLPQHALITISPETKDFASSRIHDLSAGVEYLAAQNGGRKSSCWPMASPCNKVDRYAAARRMTASAPYNPDDAGAAKAYSTGRSGRRRPLSGRRRGAATTLSVRARSDTLIEAGARADE